MFTASRTVTRLTAAARLALSKTLAARCMSSQAEKNVLRSSLAELQIPDLNVFDYVWRDSLAKHGDKTALVRHR